MVITSSTITVVVFSVWRALYVLFLNINEVVNYVSEYYNQILAKEFNFGKLKTIFSRFNARLISLKTKM